MNEAENDWVGRVDYLPAIRCPTRDDRVQSEHRHARLLARVPRFRPLAPPRCPRSRLGKAGHRELRRSRQSTRPSGLQLTIARQAFEAHGRRREEALSGLSHRRLPPTGGRHSLDRPACRRWVPIRLARVDSRFRRLAAPPSERMTQTSLGCPFDRLLEGNPVPGGRPLRREVAPIVRESARRAVRQRQAPEVAAVDVNQLAQRPRQVRLVSGVGDQREYGQRAKRDARRRDASPCLRA